jgi:hypothetical protein
MKYLCDECSRLVEMRTFEVRDGVLVTTCPSCGGASRAAAFESPKAAAAMTARPAVSESAVSVSPARSTPSASERQDETGLPADVEALWRALLSKWGEPEEHTKLIALAGVRGVLPEIGRRYRNRAEAGDTIAAQGRDEVVRHAIQLAQMTLPTEKRVARQATVTVAVAAGLLIAFVATMAAVWKILH